MTAIVYLDKFTSALAVCCMLRLCRRCWIINSFCILFYFIFFAKCSHLLKSEHKTCSVVIMQKEKSRHEIKWPVYNTLQKWMRSKYRMKHTTRQLQRVLNGILCFVLFKDICSYWITTTNTHSYRNKHNVCTNTASIEMIIPYFIRASNMVKQITVDISHA